MFVGKDFRVLLQSDNTDGPDILKDNLKSGYKVKNNDFFCIQYCQQYFKTCLDQMSIGNSKKTQ